MADRLPRWQIVLRICKLTNWIKCATGQRNQTPNQDPGKPGNPGSPGNSFHPPEGVFSFISSGFTPICICWLPRLFSFYFFWLISKIMKMSVFVIRWYNRDDNRCVSSCGKLRQLLLMIRPCKYCRDQWPLIAVIVQIAGGLWPGSKWGLYFGRTLNRFPRL